MRKKSKGDIVKMKREGLLKANKTDELIVPNNIEKVGALKGVSLDILGFMATMLVDNKYTKRVEAYKINRLIDELKFKRHTVEINSIHAVCEKIQKEKDSMASMKRISKLYLIEYVKEKYRLVIEETDKYLEDFFNKYVKIVIERGYVGRA